jgi:hypothetical protein
MYCSMSMLQYLWWIQSVLSFSLMKGHFLAACEVHVLSGLAPILSPSTGHLLFMLLFLYFFVYFWAYLFFPATLNHLNWWPRFLTSVSQIFRPASSEALPPYIFILNLNFNCPCFVLFVRFSTSFSFWIKNGKNPPLKPFFSIN